LPAELIGRRPDVIAQRLRVEATLRDVDAAKAAFYPNLDLTGFAGFQSLGLSKFFEGGSAVAAIGPAVTLPIFDGGRLRATLASKSADADAAVAAYQQAVVTALQEIADELASMRAVAAQATEQGMAVAVLQQAYDLAVLRYKEGLGTYVQVLTADTQLLAQKSLAADLRARDLDLAIGLVRSLGGGFDTLPDGTHLAGLMPRGPIRSSALEATP
jgi:NodT family efflux transporter outer membrane factor (OMF) lipoprotein